MRTDARLLIAAAALFACDDGPTAQPEGDDLRTLALAAGLAPMPDSPLRPADNPYSAAVVELGHLLFFDPIMSGPQDVACSTCHLPRFALADGRQFPSGAGATGLGPDRTDPLPSPLRLVPRNSPTVMNVGMFGRGDGASWVEVRALVKGCQWQTAGCPVQRLVSESNQESHQNPIKKVDLVTGPHYISPRRETAR